MKLKLVKYSELVPRLYLRHNMLQLIVLFIEIETKVKDTVGWPDNKSVRKECGGRLCY